LALVEQQTLPQQVAMVLILLFLLLHLLVVVVEVIRLQQQEVAVVVVDMELTELLELLIKDMLAAHQHPQQINNLLVAVVLVE
jgi:hypothetical protein